MSDDKSLMQMLANILAFVLALFVGCTNSQSYRRSVKGVGTEHIVSLYAFCDMEDAAIDGVCHGGVVVRQRLEQGSQRGWMYCAFDGPLQAELIAEVWCEE